MLMLDTGALFFKYIYNASVRMCVSALRTLGGTALSSYAAIVLWKLSFCSAGMQRTSMSERMQLDERKDDDEGGAL